MEQNNISRLLRKIRTIQFVSLLAQLLLLIAAAALILKLNRQIERQYLYSTPLLLWIAATVLLFLLSRSLAWINTQNDRRNAFNLDRLYDLKERLTTYVELKENQHPFLDPLIRETSPKLTRVSAIRASAISSTMLLPLALFLLLLSGLWILPYLPVPDRITAEKEIQKKITAKGKELEELITQIEKKQPVSPEMKKLSQEFKKFAQELQKPNVDQAEALKKLNQLEEKQKKLDKATQQTLGQELKQAWQNAAKSDSTEKSLPVDQKRALEQLVKDFEGALEGKEPGQGVDQQKLKLENFSSKDLKNLKDALKKYQEQKSQAEQMRAELQKNLSNARKTILSGKGTYTTDSHLKDRDLEKGKGGVEDGPGTTNRDAGPSHFDTRKKGKEEYIEDRTKAEYKRLYEGQREDVGNDPIFLQSQWSEQGKPQYTTVRNFGLEKEATIKPGVKQSTMQNQDESAVRKERVPPSHQEIVKKYFEAIED